MRQRHRGEFTLHRIGQLGQRIPGPPVTEARRFMPGPDRDRQLAAALRRPGGVAGRGDRRCPVTDGRQPPGPRDPQFGCEHGRLGAVPGLGARQRFRRLGDLALVGQRRRQIAQCQRAPRVAGALKDRRRRSQQFRGGCGVATGQQDLGQQHLPDGAARLGQFGEVGELPGRLIGRFGPAFHQQRGGLGQSHGEPQQARIVRAQSTLDRTPGGVEPPRPGRGQRCGAGRPRDCHVRGVGMGQHRVGYLDGPADVAGVHREGRR